MPLYQMVCIAAHTSEYARIKSLVSQTAMHIIKQGGVVRTLESWGTHSLPYRMKQQQLGDYWTLHFDTSPRTVKSLNNFLRRDPLVLRWTVLKKAEKAEDVAMAGRKLIHPILKDVELTEKTTKT